jgi:hypothetical protein
MTAFPALIPSSRTFTPGEYPATAFIGFSGAQNRVRHGNVFLAAQLRLTFLGLTQAQMLDIWNHYSSRRGEFRSFELPAEIVSYGSITDYVPGNYLWRYAGPGSVEDLPCGGHNVSLTLETVPPTAASVVGADLLLRLRLATGTADGGEYVPGINEIITLSVDASQAFTAVNGFFGTVTLSLAVGDAAGDSSVYGANFAIILLLAAGDAFDAGVLGINETIQLTLTAGSSTAEPSVGSAYGGGYFAGYISHSGDGVATHRLIVAPAATGATTGLRWKTSQTITGGATSVFDGAANTAAIVSAGISAHPAAAFCANLDIGGFSDWYLPADLELEIAYFHLKPTTVSNDTSFGVNDYSVPKRSVNYTVASPARTAVSAFQLSQSEAFIAAQHWSSYEISNTQARTLLFSSGSQSNQSKTNTSTRVRAFRREAI